MVEFALVAIVFFMLLLAIGQFGYLMYAYLSLQHAVSEAARFGITGQRGMGDLERPPVAGQSAREYTIRKVIVDRTPGINHDPSVFTIEITQLGTDREGRPVRLQMSGTTSRDTDAEGDAGGSTFNETLIIRVRYDHPFFIPLFDRFIVPIEARSSMRNEQWRYPRS
jgi:hypothetical protein